MEGGRVVEMIHILLFVEKRWRLSTQSLTSPPPLPPSLPPQGKKFFGDGIGFWIVQSPYWVEGDLHGIPHGFTGTSSLPPSLPSSLFTLIQSFF